MKLSFTLTALVCAQWARAAIFSCSGGIVSIVAHADDDLLFQSTDLYNAVSSGACITTIVLTGGDSGTGMGYAESREAGNEAAYAQMLGVTDSYTETTATFGGQPALIRTLIGAPQVQKVWFRLPDGNMDGSGYQVTGFQSLRHLYFGLIGSITNLPGTSTYTLATLQQALAEIMQTRAPTQVWTLDYLSDFDSGDHADHLATARIVSALAGTYASSAGLAGYMGYPVSNFAPMYDQGSAPFIAKTNAFFAYTPYDTAECQSFAACQSAGRGEASWLQRQYQTSSALAQQSYIGTAQTPPVLPSGNNIAPLASVTASSQASGSPATAAVDNVIGGYPGNSSAEWSTSGEGVGAWISLAWSSDYTITAIALFDRPNAYDWLQAATLTFSGGYTAMIGSLYNDGSATVFNFSTPIVAAALKLTVTSVGSSTSNIGLSEFQVYGTPCTGCKETPANTTSPANNVTIAGTNLALSAVASASSQASADQAASKANDGVPTGYPVDYTKEWASAGQGVGAWLLYTWSSPQTFNSIVAFDRPNSNDWITNATLTFDSGAAVPLGTLNNDSSVTAFNFTTVSSSTLRLTVTAVGSSTSNVGLAELEVYYYPTNNMSNLTATTDIAMLATATASSAGPGQEASKAIDGVASGYPADYTKEWASQGQANGAWLRLDWPYSVTLDSLVFCDRPNPNDWITGGSVQFADGSQLTIPSLNNDGSPLAVNFTAVQTTSLVFTIGSTGSATSNVGLSELYAYYSGATGTSNNTTPTNGTTPSNVFPINDLALNATAVASSVAAGSPASAAIDGRLGGYLDNGLGDDSAEWSSDHEGAGATLTLTWPQPISINQVVLYDRPNVEDQVLSASLTFDSGTVVSVGALPNNGTGLPVTISPAQNTSKLVFTVGSVSPSTSNIGLSELAVYGALVSSNSNNATSNSTTPSSSSYQFSDDLATGASVTASSFVAPNSPDKATDGILGGYTPATGPSATEWVSNGERNGAQLLLTWPSPITVSQVSLADRPNLNDQCVAGTLTFGDSSTVSTGSLPNDGSWQNITITPVKTTRKLLFTCDTASSTTSNMGVSEIAVFGSSSGNSTSNGNTTSTTTNVFPTNDLALNATAVASSFAVGSGASAAIDGRLGGYVADGSGDDSAEWSSDHEGAGATLTLTWPSPISINQVVLYDRPNLDDQVTGATLTFDSGLVVTVGSLPNSGLAWPINISPAQNTSKLVFRVTSVSASTSNIGLSEIAVYGPSLSCVMLSSASVELSDLVTSSAASAATAVSSALSSSTSTSTAIVPTSSALNTTSSTFNSTSPTAASTSLTLNTASSTLATSTTLVSTSSRLNTTASTATTTASSQLSSSLSTSGTTTSSSLPSAVASSSVATRTGTTSSLTTVISTSTTGRSTSTTATSTMPTTTTRVTSATSTQSRMTTVTISSTTRTTSTSTTASGTPTVTLSPSVNAAKSIATIVASSFQAQSPPEGAIDGVIGGLIVSRNGARSGNPGNEWVATSRTNQWIELRWSQPYLLRSVSLWDRVDPAQDVRSGVLTFSDGSKVNVGQLSSKAWTNVTLGTNGKVTTSLRFSISTMAVGATNAGLAEIAAFSWP